MGSARRWSRSTGCGPGAPRRRTGRSAAPASSHDVAAPAAPSRRPPASSRRPSSRRRAGHRRCRPGDLPRRSAHRRVPDLGRPPPAAGWGPSARSVTSGRDAPRPVWVGREGGASRRRGDRAAADPQHPGRSSSDGARPQPPPRPRQERAQPWVRAPLRVAGDVAEQPPACGGAPDGGGADRHQREAGAHAEARTGHGSAGVVGHRGRSRQGVAPAEVVQRRDEVAQGKGLARKPSAGGGEHAVAVVG